MCGIFHIFAANMTTMMRYLCSLLLTLMLCVSQSASAGTARNDGCLPAEKPRQTEGLVLPVNHDQQSPLATLRSGHDGYRIAGSRSYRPVPTHAPGGSRTGGKLSSGAKCNTQKISSLRHRAAALCQKSYRAVASCRCYFIAMRHIIR